MAETTDRTLSERFALMVPFLTLPYVFAITVLDVGAPLVVGIAYGVAVIFLATAVGVYDAHRNPAP